MKTDNLIEKVKYKILKVNLEETQWPVSTWNILILPK